MFVRRPKMCFARSSEGVTIIVAYKNVHWERNSIENEQQVEATLRLMVEVEVQVACGLCDASKGVTK